MQYSVFGDSNIELSRAALGCSRLGGTVERFDAHEAVELLHAAYDRGITVFDTADLYAQGNSEKLIGKAFRGRRDRVVLATKGGYTFSAVVGIGKRLKPLIRKLLKIRPGLMKSVQKVRSSQVSQNFSRDYLVNAVESSLKRLQTDYIDLYQLHSPSREVIEKEDVFETLGLLRKQGKIREFGISCLGTEDALAAFSHEGLAAVQVEINLLETRPIGALLPEAHTRSVAVIARQPFASGRLIRPADTLTPDEFGGDADRCEKTRAKVRALEEFAREVDLPLPELALRYLISQKDLPVVLIGTTRRAHLERNLELMEAGPLPDEVCAKLAPLLEKIGTHSE